MAQNRVGQAAVDESRLGGVMFAENPLIDDVGAEKSSDWVLEQLYSIINARYEEERSVVITTNLEREDLAAQIHERTVARLEEMCEVLPLYGADARRQSYGGERDIA